MLNPRGSAAGEQSLVTAQVSQESQVSDKA